MRLIFRLLFELLRSKFNDRSPIGTEIVAEFRVLPMDLDFNGHMTNNRYHSVMDFAAIRLLGAHGILAVMFRNRWRPIVGCSLISHRKSLKIFDRYCVRSKVIYCDEGWSYISHILERDGQMIAAANRKYALMGSMGLIETPRIFTEIGEDFAKKPKNIDSVRSWVDAERAVLEQSRIGPAVSQATVNGTIAIECKKELLVPAVCDTSDVNAQPCLYAHLECAEKVGCTAAKYAN